MLVLVLLQFMDHMVQIMLLAYLHMNPGELIKLGMDLQNNVILFELFKVELLYMLQKTKYLFAYQAKSYLGSLFRSRL